MGIYFIHWCAQVLWRLPPWYNKCFLPIQVAHLPDCDFNDLPVKPTEAVQRILPYLLGFFSSKDQYPQAACWKWQVLKEPRFALLYEPTSAHPENLSVVMKHLQLLIYHLRLPARFSHMI